MHIHTYYMSEEDNTKPGTNTSEESPSLAVKLVAILLGTGAALLAAYFGIWIFNKLKSSTHKLLNNGMPPASELPEALRDVSPVVWNEAKRLTKAMK